MDNSPIWRIRDPLPVSKSNLLGRMTVSSPVHGTRGSMDGALVTGPGQDVGNGLPPTGRERRPEPIPCPQCMPQEAGGPGGPEQAWACRGLSKRMRYRELRMTVLSVGSRAAIRVVVVNLPVRGRLTMSHVGRRRCSMRSIMATRIQVTEVAGSPSKSLRRHR